MNIDTLSDVPLYAARPSRYVPPKRKAATWIAVGIVHALILSLLMVAQIFPEIMGHHGGDEHETILDLTGARPVDQPEVKMVLPSAPSGVPPEIEQAPPPIIPPPTPIQPQLQEGAGAQQKGDLLGAVGRELACSAGHFENLTQAEREHCEKVPFQGLKLPTGELVMLPPPEYSRFKPPPTDQQPKLSGADSQRLQMERPSGCPAIMNTPCINQIPGR